MVFYYPSVFSFIFLAILYAVVLGVIWFVWVKLNKRKFSGPVAWCVVALVLVAPWLEELWIAWNFGQLCKKDAGVVINKVVEVEGFYDSTRPAHAGSPTPLAVKSMNESGYRFHERPLRDERGNLTKVVRIEKLGDKWIPKILDRPTARYHYTRNIYGENVAHKITRVEARVTDSGSGDVIGRYVSYGRGPYWFYISLGRPPYSCDGPDGGPNSNYNSLIYRDALKPIGK